MEPENKESLDCNNSNKSAFLESNLNKTELCLNKNSANEGNLNSDLDLTLELENDTDELVKKKKLDDEQQTTHSLTNTKSDCYDKNKKSSSNKKTNALNKLTNIDEIKDTKVEEELNATKKAVKRKKNEIENLSENELNDVEPNSKKRRIISKTSEERRNFHLKKLRKCAFHAGIVPPYKKLFENVLKTSKQIEILEQFLVDKGITKPITLEKCQRYKIQKEIEVEKENLEKNEVFISLSGKRVTRSSSKSIVKKRSVVIDDSESEKEIEEKAKSENAFVNLAGIVSSDEEENAVK